MNELISCYIVKIWYQEVYWIHLEFENREKDGTLISFSESAYQMCNN